MGIESPGDRPSALVGEVLFSCLWAVAVFGNEKVLQSPWLSERKKEYCV